MSLTPFRMRKKYTVVPANISLESRHGRRYICITGPAACAMVDVNPAAAPKSHGLDPDPSSLEVLMEGFPRRCHVENEIPSSPIMSFNDLSDTVMPCSVTKKIEATRTPKSMPGRRLLRCCQLMCFLYIQAPNTSMVQRRGSMKETADLAALPCSGQSRTRRGRAMPATGNPPLLIPMIKITTLIPSQSLKVKNSTVLPLLSSTCSYR